MNKINKESCLTIIINKETRLTFHEKCDLIEVFELLHERKILPENITEVSYIFNFMKVLDITQNFKNLYIQHRVMKLFYNVIKNVNEIIDRVKAR